MNGTIFYDRVFLHISEMDRVGKEYVFLEARAKSSGFCLL